MVNAVQINCYVHDKVLKVQWVVFKKFVVNNLITGCGHDEALMNETVSNLITNDGEGRATPARSTCEYLCTPVCSQHSFPVQIQFI